MFICILCKQISTIESWRHNEVLMHKAIRSHKVNETDYMLTSLPLHSIELLKLENNISSCVMFWCDFSWIRWLNILVECCLRPFSSLYLPLSWLLLGSWKLLVSLCHALRLLTCNRNTINISCMHYVILNGWLSDKRCLFSWCRLWIQKL